MIALLFSIPIAWLALFENKWITNDLYHWWRDF